MLDVTGKPEFCVTVMDVAHDGTVPPSKVVHCPEPGVPVSVYVPVDGSTQQRLAGTGSHGSALIVDAPQELV